MANKKPPKFDLKINDQEAALVAAANAAAAKHDLLPLLVYADWLEENGREDESLAIRHGCVVTPFAEDRVYFHHIYNAVDVHDDIRKQLRPDVQDTDSFYQTLLEIPINVEVEVPIDTDLKPEHVHNRCLVNTTVPMFGHKRMAFAGTVLQYETDNNNFQPVTIVTVQLVELDDTDHKFMKSMRWIEENWSKTVYARLDTLSEHNSRLTTPEVRGAYGKVGEITLAYYTMDLPTVKTWRESQLVRNPVVNWMRYWREFRWAFPTLEKVNLNRWWSIRTRESRIVTWLIRYTPSDEDLLFGLRAICREFKKAVARKVFNETANRIFRESLFDLVRLTSDAEFTMEPSPSVVCCQTLILRLLQAQHPDLEFILDLPEPGRPRLTSLYEAMTGIDPSVMRPWQ